MRLLVLAVCLTVSLALDCPEQCDCGTGDELEYFCTVGSAKVILNARINEYVNIKCKGTNFTCADLPVINFANDLPLRSLMIKGCSPSLLECVPSALRTSSVDFVTVTAGAAPLQAQHVVGLGAVRSLMLVRGPEKTIPVSVVHALPSLRNLRITGANLALERNFFSNSAQLEFLELSESQINEIPEDTFHGLSNLLKLNMWGNNISEIGVNSFRAKMRVIAVIQQRRGLAFAIAGVLAFIPVWLSLRPQPKQDLLQLIDLNPPPQAPFHSNSRLLPFRYWNHRSLYPEKYTDNSCMNVPTVSDLQYAASSWQLVKVENGSVYVYGAYFDDRFEEPMVRILIYTDVSPVPKLFCQLWFPDDNEPQIELAEPLYGWHPEWGGPTNGVNEPYILGCQCRRHLPDEEVAPIAVAVVTAACGVATNVMDVQNAPFEDPLKKKVPSRRNHTDTSVAICVKWLHYRNDVSVQLIEWMQLMKHFGAEKVYMYIVRLHPKTRKVLKYYEDEGFATVTELSHPPQISGFQQDRGSRDFRDLRRELLPLNDCLYRSIGRHDWLAVTDLDEIIVPAPGGTWAELIDNVTAVAAAEPDGLPFDALVFPNYYVLDGAQKDLVAPAKTRVLAHTWRARSPSPPGWCVKSFFNVSSVTAMHNHSPMACKTYCKCRGMDNGPGRMLHFKGKCSNGKDDCEELHDVVKEDYLGEWRAPVLNEVKEVMAVLGLDPLE